MNGEEKDDRKEVLAWALSLGYAITRQLGVKVAYIGPAPKNQLVEILTPSLWASLSFGDNAAPCFCILPAESRNPMDVRFAS